MNKETIKKLVIAAIIAILSAIGIVKYNDAGEAVIVTDSNKEVVVETKADVVEAAKEEAEADKAE